MAAGEIERRTATLLNFQEKVLRTLECPVCMEIAATPIHMCIAGHFVCGICRKKLRICSICRKDFTETRNYALESLMSFLVVKCKNAMCMEMVKVADLEEHLNVCEFRPVACNGNYRTACHGKLVEFSKYAEHLVKFHEAEVSIYNPRDCLTSYYSISAQNVDQGNTKWEPQPFLESGHTFLLHLELKSSILFVWVSALLSEAQAAEYNAELKFGEELKNNSISSTKFLKWSVGVGTIRNTWGKIQYSKDCAAIPLRSLLAYSQLNHGNFSFVVETRITKVDDSC